MNRYELSPNLVLSQEQSRPDFFSTTNKLYSHDQENEDYKRGYTSDFYQSRRSEVVKNNQDLSIENEIEEIKEDNYFPNIIGTDRHEEENIGNAVEPVPHKLPNLSRKYRKALKDSGSDESDSQIKNIFNSAECSPENEAKGVPHIEYEFDKNDNYDMISNNVNRSRSMLNRFNQANNTTDSRVASKNNMLPSSIKKNSRIAKDDMSSTSPHGGLNMSGCC